MLTMYYFMKQSSKRKNNEMYDNYDSQRNKKISLQNDISSKCRVCLEDGTTSILDDEDAPNILQALQLFGDIHINKDDKYPKTLCDKCNKFIKSAMLFRKIALQTNEALKQPVKEECNTYDLSEDHDFSDSSTYEVKETQKWKAKEEGEIKKEIKDTVKYTSKVTCHICNKVINRSYYKEHLTMHDPDHKKYVCDVCGKSFRLRCAYHNHSLRHRTDFPYKCQFCPYRGRYSELLKTHLRTHTGDYRYMCTECPARFLFKSNLNSHMLKHKEPEFKCEACKRAFHTKLTLQRHYDADHLGIKNHVCNICGKAFGYRNAMMKHQRHVHKREKLLFGRMPSYLEAETRNMDKN